MKEKLVILMGPTAVGKTSLSVDLAKRIRGEIISCDSMQIYKYMDIGTAKVTPDEMEGIPHYMIDIVSPDKDFSVSDYKNMASNYISQINNKGKIPLLVGGTGLYINSLVYKLNFASLPADYKFRDKMEELAIKKGNEYIYNLLVDIDKESAQRISINDRKRIIRALEIYELSGKTMSEYNRNFRSVNEDYDLAMICLNMDRAKLYKRIDDRVDIMLENGLIDEVKGILDRGYDKNLVSLQGIGYKEIINYFNGLYPLDYAIEKIKQGSRNYAKRQLTWFRRDKRIKWLDVDKFLSFEDLSDYIMEYITLELKLGRDYFETGV